MSIDRTVTLMFGFEVDSTALDTLCCTDDSDDESEHDPEDLNSALWALGFPSSDPAYLGVLVKSHDFLDGETTLSEGDKTIIRRTDTQLRGMFVTKVQVIKDRFKDYAQLQAVMDFLLSEADKQRWAWRLVSSES